MLTRELKVSGRSISPNGDTSFVRTSVGVYEMHVLFDASEWTDFPVKATFANGEDSVTQSLTVVSLDGGEWAAESTCVVPWEVMQGLGSIRVTFQGTSSGRHIITAAGTPWSVVEAGDVPEGSAPQATPTQSEWEQAYADAMAAVNAAASLVENLQSQLDAMVEEAQGEIADAIAEIDEIPEVGIATVEEPGLVKPDGDTITITEDGTITAVNTGGISEAQASALSNLQRLAGICFTSDFEDGLFVSGVVKEESLPVATPTTRGVSKPDGLSIILGTGATLSVSEEWVQSQLTTLDGALKWKGVSEREDLPEDASIGDVYIVDGSTVFWDGEDWAEISSAVDLSGKVDRADVITVAEIRQITDHRGDWSGLHAYVTQESLDSSLDAHTALVEEYVEGRVSYMESYLDEQLEAILNGSY